MMDIHKILKLIPHRYPFLLIDRVLKVDKEDSSIVAMKNVTINEPFFMGHFPGYPVMPGVLIIEALAQIGLILVHELPHIESPDPDSDYTGLMGKIKEASFKRQVIPGDQLMLQAKLKHAKLVKSNLYVLLDAKATVNDELAASASLSLVTISNPDVENP